MHDTVDKERAICYNIHTVTLSLFVITRRSWFSNQTASAVTTFRGIVISTLLRANMLQHNMNRNKGFLAELNNNHGSFIKTHNHLIHPEAALQEKELAC